MGTTSVFVSWSGAGAARVAGILRETLPSIINAIDPWTSEEIEKGENWHARLTDTISRARAAILCVTPSNVLAPWLHFEAGAIWSLGRTVCPYLVGLPKNALAGTPLSHLQATDALDEQDSLRLCMRLNDIGGNLITETVLKRSFSMWWPTWKEQLDAIPVNPTIAQASATLHTSDERIAAAAILGELLPELEYVAPILLDRLDRGLPLVEHKLSFDLGFDTGMIDARLLELFRVMAPHVISALNRGGVFGIVQSQLLHDRSEEELRAALAQLQMQNVELRRSVESIAGALSGSASVPVAPSEVDEAIAAAITRLTQDDRE